MGLSEDSFCLCGRIHSLLSCGFGSLALQALTIFGCNGHTVSFGFLDRLPKGETQANDQCRCHGGSGGKTQLVSTKGFLQPVSGARRTGDDRFVFEMPLEIRSQSISRL